MSGAVDASHGLEAINWVARGAIESDGSVNPVSSYLASDFIPCTPGGSIAWDLSDVEINSSWSDAAFSAWYDENKNFLYRFGINKLSNGVSVPNNAHYLRISNHKEIRDIKIKVNEPLPDMENILADGGMVKSVSINQFMDLSAARTGHYVTFADIRDEFTFGDNLLVEVNSYDIGGHQATGARVVVWVYNESNAYYRVDSSAFSNGSVSMVVPIRSNYGNRVQVVVYWDSIAAGKFNLRLNGYCFKNTKFNFKNNLIQPVLETTDGNAIDNDALYYASKVLDNPDRVVRFSSYSRSATQAGSGAVYNSTNCFFDTNNATDSLIDLTSGTEVFVSIANVGIEVSSAAVKRKRLIVYSYNSGGQWRVEAETNFDNEKADLSFTVSDTYNARFQFFVEIFAHIPSGATANFSVSLDYLISKNAPVKINSIFNVDSVAADNTDIVSLNSDVKSKVIQAKRRLNTGNNTYETLPPILTLLHFSDTHSYAANLKRIMEFKNSISTLIDDVICTGDMVNRFTNGMTWWDDVSGSDMILTLIGNHDVWNGTTPTNMQDDYGQEATYQRYFAPYIDKWGVTYTENKTYYYKDYPTNKIRLIMLNVMVDSDEVPEQNTWLANTLTAAKQLGYSVVIGSHTAIRNHVKIPCTFTGVVRSDIGSMAAMDTYQATVQSFIDGGGEFCCWLSGHQHADYVVYNRNYPGQLDIVVTTAQVEETWEDCARVVGDKSQDAFNIISFDTASHYVKIVRVGQDRDCYLRHMGTLVLDYSTSPATVVYND